ncbi:unnamed protein product [Zymoseptoria tritici ST99CH_1E4]|uniref:Histone deacetylase complex subunit SAP18 n=1 Tax=Zymoseptoria tritici ST99CH_1E4 TaxID=1276532 RepID=A0A2H1FXF4_ZYMTR|nr:unnamed protein product [Zymoseptoria tritici ST99CH_1E4]
MASLRPEAGTTIDRATTAPFLLRLYWRQNRQLDPWEFSVAVPSDTTNIPDYSSLLPRDVKGHMMQIYTWPNCTLAELTTLFLSVLPENVIPNPAVGTRLVFKLIFPDTRATIAEGGRGKFIDKPLGSVVIGGSRAEMADDGAENGDVTETFEGDAHKTLAEARFVIGDYVACSVYPPDQDGRVAPMPPPTSRGGFGGPRGGPPRENGFGGGYGRGGRGGYRGGYGGRGGGGYGAPPPSGDWRRGERPPEGGYDDRRGGGGYRDRGGRPY